MRKSAPNFAPRYTFTRYLDSDGRPLGELPAWAGDSDALVGLYRQMLLTRLFDQKA
ncbi:pyruvate dehydrogenase (acetyl-transferring) E1 component subunit alpha, partial [Pseudomonas aeruginosa]